MLWAKNWAILLRNTDDSGKHIYHRHAKCSKFNITIYMELCFLYVFLPGIK